MEKDYHLHKSNSSPTKIKNFGRSLLGHEDKRMIYSGNKIFVIYITSAKYLDLFRLRIGFSIKRKQDRLINYLIRYSKNMLKRNKYITFDGIDQTSYSMVG